jgi:phospholipase/carboxylesterase
LRYVYALAIISFFAGDLVLSVYKKEPNTQAQACVIWMHGLGAEATDMMGLSEQLLVSELSLRHVFIDAPKRPVTINGGMVMPAWYDILGTTLTDREDKKGIEESAQIIHDALDEQLKSGLKSEQIYLAGFSQGAAMAMYTALNYHGRLGGVLCLSGYLPLGQQLKPQLDKTTPFLIGGGQFDPVVMPQWTQQSNDWLLSHGYSVIDFHLYPMEHTVCYQELKDLSLWLTKQVQGALS